MTFEVILIFLKCFNSFKVIMDLDLKKELSKKTFISKHKRPYVTFDDLRDSC